MNPEHLFCSMARFILCLHSLSTEPTLPEIDESQAAHDSGARKRQNQKEAVLEKRLLCHILFRPKVNQTGFIFFCPSFGK